MATLELFSGGMFFNKACSLILTISIIFSTNYDYIFKITFRKGVHTRSVQEVSGLPLYLRAGVILHHRADGILSSNPHLIE